MRKLPGVSAIGRLQTEEEVQETVAPVGAQVSSTSAKPLPEDPCASFQLDFGTTPATSVGAMGVSPPTKSILIAPVPGVVVVTTKETAAVCLRDPLVPVIVRVLVPSGVLDEVCTVSLVLPGVAKLFAAKEALAPEGRPVTLSVTLPEKLKMEDVLTV